MLIFKNLQKVKNLLKKKNNPDIAYRKGVGKLM
jgi:hypothetical protein